MIRRRGRPTPPRGPQSRPAAPRGRGRPTSPRARQMQSKSPRGRAMARRRPGAQKNRATRPTISVADLRRKAGTLPPKRLVPNRQFDLRAAELKNRNRANEMLMQAAARSNPRAGKGRPIQTPRPAPAAGKGQAIQRPMPGGLQGPMRAQQDRNFAAPQRPIPNRDGRMAQMQADLARQASIANAAAARRPSIMGSLGQSNYARQPMPTQQLQRGMGRGPMPRANIGQIQAPRPTFGQQMRPMAPGQRLNRRRMPRRR